MSGRLERRVSEQRFWGGSADLCSADGRQQNQQKSRKDQFNSTDNSAKSEEYVQIHTILLATHLKSELVGKSVKKTREDRATIKKHFLSSSEGTLI